MSYDKIMADQKTNFKYIFILIILTFIAGGMALFFWWQIKVGVENMPEAQISKKAEEPPVPLDTTDWKTYQNGAYGFEFRYPLEWAVAEEEEIEAGNLFYIYDKTSCVGGCDNPSIQIRFGISENNSLLSVSAWLDQEVETESAGVDNHFVVDGSDGIKRVWRGADNRLLAVFTAFPGKNLNKIYYFLTADQQNSRILDEMLLSFRFF